MALDMQTQMRLTGMASGLDTDAIIQNLGKVSTMRVNKVKQDKQLLVWKQESYRDTISKLSGFMKSNLNTANPASNFRSSAAFAKFSYLLKGSMTIGGKSVDASDLMSVTANGDLKNFSQTVQGVAQLATKDTWTGKEMGMKGIKTDKIDFSKLGIAMFGNGSYGAATDHYFTMSIDGLSKTIMLSQEKIMEAFEKSSMYKMEHGLESNSYSGPKWGKFIDGVYNGDLFTSSNPDDFYYTKDSSGAYVKIDQAFIETKILGGATLDPQNDRNQLLEIQKYFMVMDSEGNPEHNLYSAADKTSNEAKDAVVGDFAGGTFTPGGKDYYVYDGTDGTYKKVTQSYIEIKVLNGATFNSSDTDQQEKIKDYFNKRVIYTENDDQRFASQAEALADLINKEIVTKFNTPGYGNIVQATADGELKFYMQGSNITISDQFPKDTLERMGITGGASTAGAVNNKNLEDFVGTGFFTGTDDEKASTIKINGVNISLSYKDTIATVMSKINNSSAGVTLSYSASADSFTLSSKSEGTANAIQSIDGITAEFFVGLGIGSIGTGDDAGKLVDGAGAADGVRTAAQNFIGVINGEEFMRQSNTFTYEGMTYTFNKTFNVSYEMEDDGNGNMVPKLDAGGNKIIERNGGKIVTGPDESIKIEVSKNTADIVANIKNFIDEYNTLVTHLNDLLNSKRIRSKGGAIEYPPLTDEERKALTTEEAKLYDEKAKAGIMYNDTAIRKILSDMRSAIYQKVEGVGITMADIGITTTPNFSDGGLLVINEDKLKTALENRFDEVVSLFTKSSSIPSTEKDSAKVAQRYKEVGIAQRLNDLFTAAAGTSVGGEKGFLVKQAGMVNDRTQTDNPMTKQIGEYDKKIDALLERWYRQEQNYYAMFARMETAMSKLQAQQNSLAQIMAAGNNAK